MLLQFDDVTKSYGNRPVLRHVNLTVAAGRSCAVLGPNGAGKTTLLSLMAGLVSPDAGDVRRSPDCPAEAIGYVSHQPCVYGDLDARENLRHFGRLYHLAELGARIDERLAAAGLGHLDGVPVRRYSRGMQQRLAIARALLPAPRLLLLDEPFSGLDQQGVAELESQLRACQAQGVTLVLCTHQFEYAERLAAQAFFVHDRGVQERPVDGPGALATLYREIHDPRQEAVSP